MTAAPFTPEQERKRREFDTAPQLAESSSIVRAVLALHRPWGIYDQCDHKHTEDDVDAGQAINVPEVGYTCDDGLMYQVCRECCTGGEDSDWQSEECATSHGHGKGEPICATVEALSAVLAADPEPRDAVIERMARAMWTTGLRPSPYGRTPWEQLSEATRADYRRLAAAALDASRGGTQ